MLFINSCLTGRMLVSVLLASGATLGQAQQGCCDQSLPAGEWQISKGEMAVEFYHHVLGLELPPGWTGKTNPPAPNNRELTGAATGLWRVFGLPIPGSTWGMQLVETTGIDREPLAGRRQDIGATGLILYVRDLDMTMTALKRAGAPIVTVGGVPVRIGINGSRAIVAQDPDGFFIEARQMDPLSATVAPSTNNVIGAAVSVTIGDTEKTARYWKDLLGFEVNSAPSFSKHKTDLALQGTPGAQVRKSVARIAPGGKFDYPGADVIFEFLEFKDIERRTLSPRYQDPGSGGFVLRLKTGNSGIRGKEMTDFVKLISASNQTKILTAGGNALDQGRRLAVFFQDLNGFIVEATQSTPNLPRQ